MLLKKPLLFFLSAFILLLVAGIFYTLTGGEDHSAELNQKINQRLSDQLAYAEKEAEAIIAQPQKIWSAPQHSFYLLKRNKIVAWSSNFYEPEISWFNDSGVARYVHSLRGDFIVRAWGTPNDETLLVVIPLIEKFRITNKYLGTTYNPYIFQRLRPVYIEPDGNNWFTAGFNKTDVSPGAFLFICLSGALILLLTGAFLQVRNFHRQQKYSLALWSLLAAVISIRVLMITTSFPAAWILLPSFDSLAFASSAFNPTIFDLFMNSIGVLIFSGYLLYVYPRFEFFKSWMKSAPTKRSVLGIICITISFFGFLFPFLFFESIFHDSSITLDWTQSLLFDGPRVIAFLSVITGTVTSFMFCHVWLNYAFRLASGQRVRFLSSLVVGALAFIAYYIPAGRDYLITLSVGFVYFLVLYFTRWTKGLRRTSYLTFLYLIFAVLCFGLQSSLSNRRFTDERTADFQYRFGLNFLVERDVLGEYLLNEGVTRIAQDPFVQSGLSNPFVSRGTLRQKIRQVHLSSYFNRYDVQVHLYNPSGDPVDNLSRSDLSTFVRQYKSGTGQTIYKGIYFINQEDASSAKRYVAIVHVTRQNRTMGYIALELSLKKIVPESVYPELLVDNRFAENFKAADYSYAIFQNDSLVSTFGSFNYENGFPRQWLKTIPDGATGMVAQDHRHIRITGEQGYTAVITSRIYPSFYLASNIAFWSLLGIVLITIVLMIGILINIRRFLVLNYATRIQLYVFLAFIVPLVAVSITTLYWTSLSAEDELKNEFSDNTRKLADQITPNLEQYLAGETDATPLQEALAATARLSGVDATIYSPGGYLLATNQVQIFDNLILSNLINPVAIGKIRARDNSFILEETIGKLHYNNSYRLLRSESTGRILGVLSVPFFNSGDSLDRSRVIILSNIQIVFMIIFILFTILSFTITRWFTFPLRMITRSLSNTNLKEENKPLNWQSNDEIGWMVQEYNRMLSNLEKSKIELARSQKESAWREMAQQVAHEIKNPLTPMKLTLQRLEMLMRDGSLQKDRAEEAVKNLLIQIEILNEIATSFSSFARMPAPILTRTNITAVLEKAAGLYNNHPGGRVILKSAGRPVYVMGDEQLLSRIFSNLILNGLQSGENVLVEIQLQVNDAHVVISFKDNGRGIDEALRDKVFMPHFTTKKSGSGLGLAISRQGIEQSGGSIWFATSAAGTTFSIELPVVK